MQFAMQHLLMNVLSHLKIPTCASSNATCVADIDILLYMHYKRKFYKNQTLLLYCH